MSPKIGIPIVPGWVIAKIEIPIGLDRGVAKIGAQPGRRQGRGPPARAAERSGPPRRGAPLGLAARWRLAGAKQAALFFQAAVAAAFLSKLRRSGPAARSQRPARPSPPQAPARGPWRRPCKKLSSRSRGEARAASAAPQRRLLALSWGPGAGRGSPGGSAGRGLGLGRRQGARGRRRPGARRQVRAAFRGERRSARRGPAAPAARADYAGAGPCSRGKWRADGS